MTDRETLRLLEQDPEAGMAALIDAYSGLLWKAASGRLKDQEDIRDCVSETFSEFYLHRENFDPEKGTLAGYLAAIARRRVLRRWESNSRQNGLYAEPDEEPDPFRQIEQRAELDEALSRLEAEDEKILRMKYYQGLSAKEIAAALDLPYETVKKRHQRSLSKLRKWLIAGLILALLGILAACAYVVLRQFGIIPGYGPVSEPGTSVWVLAEPVTVEFEYGTATLVDAMLMDGVLTLSLEVSHPDKASEQLFLDRVHLVDGNDPSTIPAFLLNGTAYRCPHFGSSNHGELVRSYTLRTSAPPMEGLEDSRYPYPVPAPEDGRVELQWETVGISVTFSMEQVTAGRTEGYSRVYHQLAGLLASPRREEERLQVELYGLPTGEGYDVASNLLWGAYMEGRTGDITLTGADGQVYTGDFVPVAYSNDSPRAGMSLWDFGEVEPGEYTLHVPYLFLTTDAGLRQEPILPVDLMAGTWEDTPVELLFGSVRVTGLESLGPGESLVLRDEPKDCRQRWRFTLRWEPPEGLDMTMPMCFAESKADYLPGWTAQMQVSGLEMRSTGQEELPENCFQWYIGLPEDTADWVENIQLLLGRVQSCRWEQSFEMTITVD